MALSNLEVRDQRTALKLPEATFKAIIFELNDPIEQAAENPEEWYEIQGRNRVGCDIPDTDAWTDAIETMIANSRKSLSASKCETLARNILVAALPIEPHVRQAPDLVGRVRS